MSYYEQPQQRGYCPQSAYDPSTTTFNQSYAAQGAPQISYSTTRQSTRSQYPATAYPSPPEETFYSPTTVPQKHKGVYVCLYATCAGRKYDFDRKADLQRHTERCHDPKPKLYDCPYAGQDNCSRYGSNGLPRPDKVRDHLHDKHKLSRDAIDRLVGGGRRPSRTSS